MNKYVTCCFTGHRPQKLGFRFDENSNECRNLKSSLKAEIINAINQGYKFFICGGGLGVDMYASNIIIDLKSEYPYISLHLALPCHNHTKLWKKEQTLAFKKIMSLSDKIIYVSEKDYFEGCMIIRNKYMIDNSNLLVAAFNGSPGGTKQTLEYAKKSYINIVVIEQKIPMD